MRNLMDKMNYCFENPTVSLGVDEEITKLFKNGYERREHRSKEQFLLWASMSRENVNNKLETILKSQELDLENSKQNSK